MLLRTLNNDGYELPLVTWAVWAVVIIGTPLTYLSPKGRTYQFRASLAQCLLVTSLAFGLFNSGLNAVTLFNLPLIALLAAIFFSPTVALKQLGIAIAVLIGFLIAKLLGYLPEITDANWGTQLKLSMDFKDRLHRAIQRRHHLFFTKICVFHPEFHRGSQDPSGGP